MVTIRLNSPQLISNGGLLFPFVGDVCDIGEIYLCNTTTMVTNVNIFHLPSNVSTASANYQLFSEICLAANETMVIKCNGLGLRKNDNLLFTADQNGTVSVNIYGYIPGTYIG